MLNNGSLKAVLREKMLAERKNMPLELKAELDRLIANLFCESQLFKNAATVMLYASAPVEISTMDIISRLGEKKAAFPKCCTKDHSMEFYFVESSDDLVNGAYNIPEPRGGKICTPDESCVCVVPCLAFDDFGTRLGFGGGYYDRYFARYTSVVKVLLCYSFARQTRLCRNSFDICADYIITEKSITEAAK